MSSSIRRIRASCTKCRKVSWRKHTHKIGCRIFTKFLKPLSFSQDEKAKIDMSTFHPCCVPHTFFLKEILMHHTPTKVAYGKSKCPELCISAFCYHENMVRSTYFLCASSSRTWNQLETVKHLMLGLTFSNLTGVCDSSRKAIAVTTSSSSLERSNRRSLCSLRHKR